ncbi:MAG: hypothetical protein EZS28_005984 [Streblomastix strix]|uniref:Uncharacterized protein n=1 Tax=Streblomastix strix TaxID=222440 RepID=A0A5J4WTY2_9EUKA|nr:MAG: hypothetical protein EZS28_005984 [Streblomastix strix]
MVRKIQQMIIERQKYNIQKKYMQTIGVFDDWMKGKNYTIIDIMNKKIPLTNTQLMTRLITQDIGVPGTSINFKSIGERPENNILSNDKLQVMLASLLIEHTAAVCFQHKQYRKREKYDVRRINDPRTIGVQNATENFKRHTSSTELAVQGFDGRTIKVFTHHTQYSKKIQQFYIFAVNNEQDSITSALVKNRGEKQATQIISKQEDRARVSEGDVLQQSPLGDDLQLSPCETLASLHFIRIISTQLIVDAEFPNDHKSAKVQNSQMQKDDQDVKPQKEAQNSSMTKDTDRATTAGAQK